MLSTIVILCIPDILEASWWFLINNKTYLVETQMLWTDTDVLVYMWTEDSDRKALKHVHKF